MKKSGMLAIGIFSLALAVILTSCLEELEKIDKIASPTFRPTIDFPLVNSDFSMEEFLTEGESKARITEQSGIMVLTYDDSVSTPSGESFFFLPDQQSPTLSISGSEISFSSPGTGQSITLTKNINFAFSPGQSEVLESILIKSGALLLDVTSSIAAGIDITVSIPSLTVPSLPFSQNFAFINAANRNQSTNLQGATLDLTANGTTTNTISFVITVVITDTGGTINSTDRLDCSFDLDNLRFRGLFGNLGSRSFPFGVDSIDVDILGNAVTGTFELLSPAVQLDIDNSFGFPVGFNIQNISIIKPDNSMATLSGPAVSPPANPHIITAPTQPGQFASSQVNINSGNSNLSQLISALPRYLTFQFAAQLNPGAVTQNFVLDDSQMNIGVHLQLPFHGRIASLNVTKRYDFDGIGIEDMLESSIKVKTINETPLEAAVQVYFMDNNGVILDSLFTNRSILKGAPVDADAVTQGAAEVLTEVAITQAKVDRINQATELVISATLFTTDAGSIPVKFSVADKLKVTIGVSTKYEYKVK